MPTATYTPIASTTLTGTSTSVVFSSIPATYRDLILVCEYFTTDNNSGTRNTGLRINSDTGGNYNRVYAYGDGSSAASASESSVDNFKTNIIFNFNTGNRLVTIFNIMDYVATDKHKSVLYRSQLMGTGQGATEMSAGRWANTSAVTSLTFFSTTNSLAIGSTFSLYGVIA